MRVLSSMKQSSMIKEQLGLWWVLVLLEDTQSLGASLSPICSKGEVRGLRKYQVAAGGLTVLGAWLPLCSDVVHTCSENCLFPWPCDRIFSMHSIWATEIMMRERYTKRDKGIEITVLGQNKDEGATFCWVCAVDY